jgi:hypothetical protein
MHPDDERSNAEIARAWIAHYVRTGPPSSAADIKVHDADPDHWANGALGALRRDDPARALEIVFRIARDSADAWVLENLGAGPLEDLIDADPTLLDPIALEVASSPNLKTALQSVWEREMSDETWNRLQRIAGA